MTLKIIPHTAAAFVAAVLSLSAPGRATATEKQPQSPASGGAAPATQDDVKTLAEEVRRLKLEMGLKDVEYKSYGGLGPAASKVYFGPKGLSIGGYGEFNYQNDLDSVSGDQTDMLRAVLYVGYRFNEKIVFDSEIEFEHGGKEISVEFAFLDFLLSDAVRLRLGHVLVPVGYVNEMHEPPFFNGVFRPDVERRLIPSTWHENGVGLHGEVAGLRYKAYLLAGLDLLRDPASLAEPVESASWIRESRTGAAEARAATFAGVLALGYDAGPVAVGGSFYRGRADQRRLPGVKADVTLAELHAQLAWKGFTARALATVGTLGDAAAVNAFLTAGSTSGDTITLGSRATGGYLEAGYDVLQLVSPGGEQSLTPFVRLEKLDLNAKVPAGAVRDGGLDQAIVTAGLTYKPIPTVVVKADLQRRDPRVGDTSTSVNVGAGFVF